MGEDTGGGGPLFPLFRFVILRVPRGESRLFSALTFRSNPGTAGSSTGTPASLRKPRDFQNDSLPVIPDEMSNANEVEGSRTPCKPPSPAQLRERASGAAVAFFCNRRDARVRVQRVDLPDGFYLLSEFLTHETNHTG
jgi:hypothetical protein